MSPKRKTFTAPALLPAIFLIGTLAAACGGESENRDKDLCADVTCGSGQTCNPATGQCEVGAVGGLCADVTCPDGQVCNPATGQCEVGAVGDLCADVTCPDGQVCNPTTGACEGNATCGELTISGEDVCELTGSGEKLLIRADILAPGVIYEGGSVLVGANGKIECVGCKCSAEGAKVITCPNAVVSPGLINAHEHISYSNNRPVPPSDERFDHRHDWRKGKNNHTNVQKSYVNSGAKAQTQIHAELRMLMGGATSIFASGKAKGLLRNLDTSPEGLGLENLPSYDTFPLGDSGGTLKADSCDYSYKDGGFGYEKNYKEGCPYGPHVAEGITLTAWNELRCLSPLGENMGGKNIFNKHSAFIHGIAATPELIALMAQSGTKLIWSPRSNVSLYGDTAPVTVYDNYGVIIAMGTDWVSSGSMNMLRELQCADGLNKNYFNKHFTDEQLWQMVTVNGAIALGFDDLAGAIKVGQWADLAIFAQKESRKAHRAVIDAEPQDVLLVTRAGKRLYGEANLIADSTCDEMDVCGRDKKACVKDETGYTLAELESGAKSDKAYYELFFCGTPEDEPSCVPSRERAADTTAQNTTMYDGVPTEGLDSDGDGIPDVSDNCPHVFNPIRPQDGGKQADADGDGFGDACDKWPLCEANDSTCPPTVNFDPNDRDGDGIPNEEDLCPHVALTAEDTDPQTKNHKDTDGDGKGDACDTCPTYANPGDKGCLATIYQVKNGTYKPGERVTIRNMLVVASSKSAKGFFGQIAESDDDYAGADYSGILVYLDADPGTASGSRPAIRQGDRVNVEDAEVYDFYGQLELQNAAQITVVSSGNSLPNPVEVSTADVATGGPRAAQLESVLIKVSDLTVTTANPDTTEYREFVVTSAGAATGLRIDDLLYSYSDEDLKAWREIGTEFTSITGLLIYRNSNYKLLPRDENDVAEAMAVAKLNRLECPEKLRVGKTGTCTVSLARAVSAATSVQMIGADDQSVTIAASETSADVMVTIPDDATGTHTVKAYLDSEANAITAQITVVPAEANPTRIKLTGPATATAGTSVELTLALDNPSTTDFGLSLSLGEGSCGKLSSETLTIRAEELTAIATLDTTGCTVEQQVVITATPADTESGVTGDSLTLTIVEAPTGKGVVINQIMTRGSNAYDEFVELYNPTSAAIDLSNYVLWKTAETGSPKEDNSLPLSGSIPAQGFYLIASSNGLGSYDVSTDYADLNDTRQGLIGGLNGKSALWLTNSNNVPSIGAENLVDLVGLGTNVSFEGTAVKHSDKANISIGRKSDGQDSDNNAEDFEQKNPACPRSSKSTTCPALKG